MIITVDLENKLNNLSEAQKGWLEDDFARIIRDHYRTSYNEHIIALNSEYPETVNIHDYNSESHKEYANTLADLAMAIVH